MTDDNGREYRSQINEALSEADVQTAETDDIEFSNGVVLEAVKVPPMLVMRAVQRFKYPPVPIIKDEEDGREIPNPMDEDYLARCAQIDEHQGNAVLDILLGKGTRLKSCPDTVPSWDTEEWIEDAEYLLDEVIDRRRLPRYLMWVKYVACESADDLEKAALKCYNKFGVSGASLEEAFAKFRSETPQSADTPAEAQ
jgi:hypothetical protein